MYLGRWLAGYLPKTNVASTVKNLAGRSTRFAGLFFFFYYGGNPWLIFLQPRQDGMENKIQFFLGTERIELWREQLKKSNKI